MCSCVRRNTIHSKITQAVILAGGRGKRLRPFTDSMPKAMYPIHGIPFIIKLLEQIKSFGIGEVIILLGYLADRIVNELGNGEKYGIKIQYDITPEDYNTSQRILHAKNFFQDRFLLMYCDNYCPINFSKLVADSYTNHAAVQISAYTNKDHYTKDNLIISRTRNEVLVYDKSRTGENLSGVDIGYAIVKKEALSLAADGRGEFAENIYPKLIQSKTLFATVTDHRYYSIGSFERIKLTTEFFRLKRVAFLDRDGTLNIRPPKACYVEKASDFQWIPGAKEAVRMLMDHEVMTILISNQPGIARGNLTVPDLDRIHEKMQGDLNKIGAKIDYIYYCPHNWDDECDCRKPKPGMLYQAQRELSLDLSKCVLFGDDERDIAAGNAAGCKSVLVSESYPFIEAAKDYCRKIEAGEL